MFDLKNKKALVTGGSRGIGRGIALALAKAGADVAVNYHSNEVEALKIVEEIKAKGKSGDLVIVFGAGKSYLLSKQILKGIR